jgi:hypothetical protein
MDVRGPNGRPRGCRVESGSSEKANSAHRRTFGWIDLTTLTLQSNWPRELAHIHRDARRATMRAGVKLIRGSAARRLIEDGQRIANER